ncbi:hypothetical protein PMAYCL1PPCAC_23675 [Pristionchus mayeri]|uniref:RRM domain-containing protein n=1 Tax=Pristionchus mayeri TaxID=1317129 RepID=A0AAN5CZW3_9BILA|nr:hypothetical protein PMAYCL1PPCAC_23675 [Pristionchus mayeri]
MTDVVMSEEAVNTEAPAVPVKEEEIPVAEESIPGDNNGSNEEDRKPSNGDSSSVEKVEVDERTVALVSQGVSQFVADKMIQLFDATDVTSEDFDERALEMLKQFPKEEAVYLIEQLIATKLFGVQNKPQYLMSVMRNLRDRVRQLGATFVLSKNLIGGPVIEEISSILDRTGYKLEVTVGQRKYGGPPPDWEGAPTGPGTNGHEVYIGHIPHEMYEDKLIPLFEEIGKIWDLRLMMDPMTGQNRGYAFLTYCEKGCATEAAKKFDGHEIASGKTLKVNVSVANTRLFIGNIPKSKTKEEILEEFRKHSDGVLDVIIYAAPDGGERNRNRGFCFVDFADHKTASDAKRKFSTTKGPRPFNHELVVDWAEQQDEPSEEEMSKVKSCYVRNLKEAYTEEMIKERFEKYGKVERVKKVKEYAFVHFEEREDCIKAIEAENGAEVDGVSIECSLAKPQVDKKKRGPMRGGRGGNDRFGGGYGRGRGAQSGSGGANAWNRSGGYADFAAGYGTPQGGYDYGSGGGYGGYGAADPYGGYGASQYGASQYGASPYGSTPYGGYSGGYGGAAGDYGSPMGGGGGYGGGRGGGGGYGSRGGMGGGRGGGRGRGNGGGFRGGAKRPGDWSGGPASKRGDPDFSADVNMGGY